MKRCLGCMCEYENGINVCPHCGYAEGTTPEEAIHMTPGTRLADRYLIGRTVGFGGFGVTYIAWDEVLQVRVAIKEYLPSEFSTRMPGRPQLTVFNGNRAEQFSDGMKRFVEEAKRLAQFQNEPGIVRVFDCLEENGTAYIIMEYLEGITLAEYLKEVGTLPEDVAVEMLMPIMKSLSVVHKASIIHRDVSPDNIMITTDNQIKLIDFGAARQATTSHSRSLTVIVKPGYSPEEQYRSRGDQGPYTDVYSVGAVLYKMITGKTPVDAMERRAGYEANHKDILPPISKNAAISENHENAIANAMNIRIEDRTQNMSSLIEELHSTTSVVRKNASLKRIDVLKWPLWAKIVLPTALVALITVLVLFMTGVIGFNMIGSREIFIPDGMTQVPNIVGEKDTDAMEHAKAQQLNMIISSSETNDQIQKGCVMFQETSWGSMVEVNSVLGVIISDGPAMSEVPFLTGMQINEAKAALESAKLEVVVAEVYDNLIQSGYVIGQDIEGGTVVKSGSSITLIVSKGRDSSIEYDYDDGEMPDFIGKTLEEIAEDCEKYGIQVKVADYDYSEDYPPMTILKQSVAPGMPIDHSEVVSLTLCKGAFVIKMPNVMYKNLDTVKKLLDELKINWDYETQYSENVASGLVMSQSIAEGIELDENSKVHLVISLGCAPVDMIQVVGMSYKDAYAALDKLGLVVKVEYKYSGQANADEVLSQGIQAGTKVAVGSEVYLTVNSKAPLQVLPDVTGMDFSTAKTTLEKYGFVVEKIEAYGDAQKGNVFKQTPAAGTQQPDKTKISLTVSLGKQPFNVTFNANGGSLNGKPTITVYKGDNFGTMPTATKQYCTFAGWYTAADAGERITETSVVDLTNNIVLYAHWTAKVVTVTYNVNGGTMAENSRVVYKLGDSFGNIIPTKTGYGFGGWFTENGGKGTRINDGETVVQETDFTLYAYWTANKYKVTFNANGGSCSTTQKDVTYASTYGTLPTPTRTGYNFSGWYTAKSGGSKVTDKTTVTIIANQTLYAQWKEKASAIGCNLGTGYVSMNGYFWDMIDLGGTSFEMEFYTTSTIKDGQIFINAVTNGSYFAIGIAGKKLVVKSARYDGATKTHERNPTINYTLKENTKYKLVLKPTIFVDGANDYTRSGNDTPFILYQSGKQVLNGNISFCAFTDFPNTSTYFGKCSTLRGFSTFSNVYLTEFYMNRTSATSDCHPVGDLRGYIDGTTWKSSNGTVPSSYSGGSATKFYLE